MIPFEGIRSLLTPGLSQVSRSFLQALCPKIRRISLSSPAQKIKGQDPQRNPKLSFPLDRVEAVDLRGSHKEILAIATEAGLKTFSFEDNLFPPQTRPSSGSLVFP